MDLQGHHRKNVDDLMSVCGNMQELYNDPCFPEGRAARRQWLLGLFCQCYMPFLTTGKIRRAVKGIEGLSIWVTDYWDTGNPAFCEAAINGMPVFKERAFFMSEEQIRESVKSLMI